MRLSFFQLLFLCILFILLFYTNFTSFNSFKKSINLFLKNLKK